jgi:hypothetical protein
MGAGRHGCQHQGEMIPLLLRDGIAIANEKSPSHDKITAHPPSDEWTRSGHRTSRSGVQLSCCGHADALVMPALFVALFRRAAIARTTITTHAASLRHPPRIAVLLSADSAG